MRYINTTSYNPKRYRKESRVKLIELMNCVDSKARKDFLDVPANRVWTTIKSDYERLSNYKCWFSEAYANVSDFQIEHFRPKKRVHLIKNKDDYPEKRTVTDNEGYWWLSYDLRNLKLVGAKPNQIKGNYFPLKDTSIVATAKNESWIKEENALLDPCRKEDVKLLTYSGIQPIEYDPVNTNWDHVRARISIEVFGLKHRKLKIARATIFAHLKNYVDTGKVQWNYLEANKLAKPAGYQEMKALFVKVCINIVEMMNPKEQFTKMVYAHLFSLNIDWVNDYVLEEAKNRKYI